MFKKLRALLFVFMLLCFFVACDKKTESKESATDKSVNLEVSERNTKKETEVNLEKEVEIASKEEAKVNSKAIQEKESSKKEILKDKKYYELEEVVQYLKKYNKLPVNYVTKEEAKKLGWDNKQGNLWEVTDKLVIGGDRFGNREGKLPKAKKRNYFEADIDYNGGFRNHKRIVYSNDGLIFYTEDHYNSFERID